ncbi:hypothetical protein ACFY7X_13685 [Streptomyces althioticus]|uniref:hypothetical protein n=1 Tax=Streptomyces althioticus TaxID=83380 RepID=UPI0033DC226E
MNRRTYALAALLLALLATVTACEKTYPAGPTGKVTDRSRAYYKSGGWKYWLTVDGAKFRVTRDDYRSCFRGSAYPTCTHR